MNWNPSSVTLPLADADGSGAVDFSDFLALSANFGGPGGWGQADFDADSLREATLLGVVDLYLRTLQAQARSDATQARRDDAQALAGQAQDFLEVGTGNRLDLVRALNRLENENAALALQQRDVETTKLLLLDTCQSGGAVSEDVP